ncbi:glycosyltransferase family 2 protein [Patescibacteria group bacterium]|nr:glycosyltransferase family 2 protein [Patescibacteria group bacterium]
MRRTLEGLSIQSLKPVEVVVIDDGSEDNPETVVRDFVDRLPIKFHKLYKNHGAPYVRNLGARMTTAPLIIFLDADAELVPNALEFFALELESNTDADFVYSNFFWGIKRFKARAFNFDALKKRNYIHTSSLMRRSCFPGFDESLKKFQDWDLWLNMAERGSRGVWINHELYRIEPRRQGMSRWMPRIAYLVPWSRFGFMPKELTKYRQAEEIVRKKHGI